VEWNVVDTLCVQIDSTPGREQTMTDARRIGEAPEVEGQFIRWSDENLKQAITQVENALAALAKLNTRREPTEVEGQWKSWSDENLKQAIEQVKSALAALKALQPEIEGQGVRY
jgi:hypothetical protein